MSAWDFLVDKRDLTAGQRRDFAPAPLAAGEARLAVESFAVTANNVTYGAIGDAFGYWKFFPAPEGLGRIPVWGFARVTESRAEGIEPGLRLFGYLPMSSEFTARLVRSGGGVVDAAAHRAQLPPTYNQYAVAQEPTATDDHRSLLRPLFGTSWLIDDMFEEHGDFGARSVVITSASSKTGLGFAWRLAKRGVKAIGLTSPASKAFLEGLGIFHQVVTYDEADAFEPARPLAIVDFAGNRGLIAKLHRRFGDDIVHSAIIGVTHWQAEAPDPEPLAGPQPTLFFAPDQIRKRAKEWGSEGFDQRFTANLAEFIAASPWLKLQTGRGPDGLAASWDAVVRGRAPADVGMIVKL
ncbi:DUF2855 family protein [Caulobacter sp. SLTY]|uniref:DUF2855 family protein n=1 Tax=Caulobacter sp. SLTY TaxID=2683262 RepID=UPI001412DD19|nr:DUF2855 family protein [Caulobacter sp. SLTY]NBB14719.1 DUF2855 family protein [Caulobacter sp. SLTY]